jgi:hypothetical protein
VRYAGGEDRYCLDHQDAAEQPDPEIVAEMNRPRARGVVNVSDLQGELHARDS